MRHVTFSCRSRHLKIGPSNRQGQRPPLITGLSLLEISDLTTSFALPAGDLRAVDGVTLSVDSSRILGLAGESGCGKSVLALTIMGLLPRPAARVAGGSIRFAGRELTTLSPRELEDVRGKQIGMVFQDPMTALSPTLTVGAQLADTLRRHLGLSRKDARTRAAELLDEVRIGNAVERLDQYVHEFSGGMRQRAMIAIAIACEPTLLIADEPTTALDVTVQAEVLDLLDDLRAERGMAMIMITHDMSVLADLADEIAIMYAGQVVERAPARAIFAAAEHPYTEALLGALPQLDATSARTGRLLAIPGQPPNLMHPPSACRFASRCPYAGCDDSCTQEMPVLREVREGHWVRSAHPSSERPVAGGPR